MECVFSILVAGAIAFVTGWRFGKGSPLETQQASSIFKDAYRLGYDACTSDARNGLPGISRPGE